MRPIARATRSLLLATICALALTTAAEAADATLRPGKWEVVTTGSVDQAGQKMDMPESRSEMCIATPADSEANTSAVDTSCTIDTLEESSGKLVTRATCGEIVTDSTMTWNDDSYESITHMVMTSGGATVMVSDMKATGRYLGACEG